MTTYVIEISNPRHSDGKPYERVEVEGSKALKKRMRAELGRPLTAVEELFIGCGAKLWRVDQQTSRTVTAYKQREVEQPVAVEASGEAAA
jgi:hypothetical protein